jgi:anthranilate synthase component 1
VKPISFAEFANYAKDFNVIPIAESFLADGETPLTIYSKLTGHRENTFLLESAEHAGSWSRYSFIGVSSQATLIELGGKASWLGNPPVGVPEGTDPLTALRQVGTHLRTPRISGLPRLTSGLVGYLGYDAIRYLEKIPAKNKAELSLPEIAFILTSDLAIFDHLQGTVTLIANAINWDGSDSRVAEAYEGALKRLAAMKTSLLSSNEPPLAFMDERPAADFHRRTSSDVYIDLVNDIKEDIKNGEAFQVVLSQRFEIPCHADAFDVYRMLRLHNPSPYMFLLRFENKLSIVGSSPEALVKVTDGEVMVHPIAGTRKRSTDAKEDIQLGEELLSDPKERAEHLMLVDLGRNDLGRVCDPGSVKVSEFMQIERYSHVMHIVSTVTGKLAADHNSIDALYAVFPAGTLSGAPKPRAMEIIEEKEDFRREIYGGAIGYLDFTGNLDSCIAIRTAVLVDQLAVVQAGAGIVADSDPVSEDNECLNKAAAVLGAIAAANNLRKLK